jgi:predicted  nucleic acid-binding Zn-ribbon protein
MTEKKGTTKKAQEKQDAATQEQMELLQSNALQLQNTAQSLANQLQQYMQLCKHYEQTINILTGRLQEQQRLFDQLQQTEPEAS